MYNIKYKIGEKVIVDSFHGEIEGVVITIIAGGSIEYEKNNSLTESKLTLQEVERTIREFIPHRDSEYCKPLAEALIKLGGVNENIRNRIS